ncbi:MAG: Acyl-protein synthetase, LuxE [Promethearchaeota archaeon]|nr:MAG: Acyl-protein synthetase, LuxE [Candidatus Lokiarchaeota archaeon]
MNEYTKKNGKNFFQDLSLTIKETANDCELYQKLCKDVDYDFNRPVNESNLGDIPYVPWSFFKQSNNKFKQLLRGNTFEKLDYWMESSSTSGDPSIVGRLQSDIEVLKQNYNRVFTEFSEKDKVKNLILFAPKKRFIEKIKHTFYGKDSYLLYKSIVDIWYGKDIHYLLQFFLGKTILNMVKTLKARAVIGINGKKLEDELNRVEKNKIPTIMANSPLWMHKVLKDFYEKKKKTFDMSDRFYIITGGGGWDGVKGRIKMGNRVDKTEFVEQMCKMFNITKDKFCDNFAATESPLACGAHWSDKYDDFLFHVDKKYGRILARDINTLEPITQTGKPGVLELITPYGVKSYAGVAVLLDDIIQIENWERCSECGREGSIFRITGRLTPSIGKGCSSLFSMDAYKL